MPKQESQTEPVCVEITVSHNAGGKIAINDYGKRTSDWGVFMSQKFTIPPGWTQEEVDAFQLEQHAKLFAAVEEIDQREHDVRWEAKQW